MEEGRHKFYSVKPRLEPKSKASSKSPESKYWSSFKTQEITDLISVPSLSFSPIAPHHFAAAHSASISLFSSQSLSVSHTITDFSDVVASISYRSDGSLLAASDLSGLVQVFDVKTRKSLRRLESHTCPVRFVKYPILDKFHLVSGGDDGLVKYWDVASNIMLLELTGHKDYVRCGDFSSVSADSFVTGSYDHLVKLWDVRLTSSKAVMEVNHGKPVEDVIFLSSGNLIATAGGNFVKIWDLIEGGKMLYSMECHTKTVTSITVSKIGKANGEEGTQHRILSVALDGYMKVFDYANMKVTHSMRLPTPLLSIGLSPDCKVRAIGTSNGSVYAGKREGKDGTKNHVNVFPSCKIAGEPQRQILKPCSYKYFHSGHN